MNVDETVNIEYTLEFEDAFRNLLWQSLKRVRIILILPVLIIAGGVFEIVKVGSYRGLIGGFTIIGFFGLIFLAESYFKSKKLVGKIKGPIRYSFMPDEYKTETPMGSASLKWNSLEEIKETAKDYLLFPQKPIFVIVPKRAFKDAEERRRFEDMAAVNLGDKAKFKKRSHG